MILANARERLTAADWQFVVAVLSRVAPSRRGYYSGLAATRPAELLDEPGLFQRLLEAPGIVSPSAPLFLYLAIRDTLRSVGVDDPELSDYLAALVLEFGLRDRAYRIAPADDAVYYYVTDIVADLEAAPGQRGFLLRAHLGNFSLWLSGVFPDHVTARQHGAGGPDLDYYDEMGALGFRMAAEHTLAREWRLRDIYARAAESFETLRVGLNRLSDNVFFRNLSSADRLMRQVRDEVRLFGGAN